MNIRVGKVEEMNNKRKGEDARDFRSKKKTDRGGNWGHSILEAGSQQSDPWAERLAPAAMQKERGVEYTVSMAIPSSLNSAQTRELKTYLVSQIARAAVRMKWMRSSCLSIRQLRQLVTMQIGLHLCFSVACFSTSSALLTYEKLFSSACGLSASRRYHASIGHTPSHAPRECGHV